MKVFLLDNNDSFTYNLVQLVESILNEEITVAKNHEISLEQIADYNKIILSPGPGLPNEHQLIQPLLSAYYKTHSILGICLGHQAIAQHFGATLFNKKDIKHGIKKEIEIKKNTSKLFPSFPSNISVGLYNSWLIKRFNFPQELEITSIDKEENIMSLKHKQYDIEGVQFHPESILTPYGEKLLTNWLKS